MNSIYEDFVFDSNISLYNKSIKNNSKNPYCKYISSKNYTWENEGEKVIFDT